MRDVPPGFRRYAEIVWRLGEYRGVGEKWVSFRCPFADRHKNGDAHWSGLGWIGDRGELVARCLGCGATWSMYKEFVGLPASAWWPAPLERRRMDPNEPKPKPVAEYFYSDREGALIAVKVRLEPGIGGRAKSFVWRRPVPDEMRRSFQLPRNQLAWVTGPGCLDAGWYARDKDRNGVAYFGKVLNRTDSKAFELPAAKPSLYRLPEVVRAKERMIFVCEGEKDVDRLQSLGFVATCGANGSSDWLIEDGAWLADSNVCVVPHCDDPGYAYALRVVASCVAFRTKTCRWLDLPNARNLPGYDVCDWLHGLSNPEAKKAVIEMVQSLPVAEIGLLKPRKQGAA